MLSRHGNLITNGVLSQKINVFVRSVCAKVLEYQEIPSPRGLPIVGTTLALLVAGSTPKLHQYVDKRHKELGPIFRESIGPVEAIFVSNPEAMRAVFAQEGKYPVHILPEAWILYNEMYSCSRGLFFMEGEEWLRFRKIMNNFLLKGDLTWIDQACETASDGILSQIEKSSIKGEKFNNLEGELYKWSLDVILSIVLGREKYKEVRNEVEPSVIHLANTVHMVFQTSAKLALIPAKLAAKYRIPRWTRFEKSIDNALLAANHLVTMLLNDYADNDGLLKKLTDQKLLRQDITKLVADLVLAAGDTTAYSMEWILYLVAKNKQIQTELRQELSLNPSPPLLRNTIRESLRLYPVAPFLTRFIPDEAIIEGYKIPPRSLIVMSIYTSGRDASYFKDPAKFLPDRWLTGGRDKTLASLPFAMGARSCIGRRIAETQMRLTLAKIVTKFDIELCNKRDVDMVLKMVAVPSEDIRLKFHELD